MPALALYNFGNAVFSAIGDTKKPLMYQMCIRDSIYPVHATSKPNIRLQ